MTDHYTECLTATLAELEAMRVPRCGCAATFTTNDVTRRHEILFDRRRDQDFLLLQMIEVGGDRALRERMAEAEAIVAAAPALAIVQPEDAVLWPSDGQKRKWHLVEARADLIEGERQRMCDEIRGLLAT